MEVGRRLLEWTPIAAMVMVECLDVSLSMLGKAAMEKGMNHFVFVVYYSAFATLILLPLSFFINRTTRAPLSFSLLCKFFLLSIFGITVMQNCIFTAIDYSSPTLGSAMINLTPAITFVLAVILGMEKLNIGSSISQIKVMGTVISISGALLVTLYKGSPITSFGIPHSPSKPLSSLLAQTSSNWAIGGLLFAIASLSLALCNITQDYGKNHNRLGDVAAANYISTRLLDCLFQIQDNQNFP
ncbi:unnamed protein product [Sphenostylis stenocarpa]|uniref:WAT1-related protein n=1 Tax=Sphenostylis stenocarpa TaxID=92480 RepID=A0AA86S9F9_9FABA|nr:unnamed protein product [Sphenostylis stenocarpa]